VFIRICLAGKGDLREGDTAAAVVVPRAVEVVPVAALRAVGAIPLAVAEVAVLSEPGQMPLHLAGQNLALCSDQRDAGVAGEFLIRPVSQAVEDELPGWDFQLELTYIVHRFVAHQRPSPGVLMAWKIVVADSADIVRPDVSRPLGDPSHRARCVLAAVTHCGDQVLSQTYWTPKELNC
jgi:hypothetical protein